MDSPRPFKPILEDGIDAELQRTSSWASLRDNLQMTTVDAVELQLGTVSNTKRKPSVTKKQTQ